jgi:hypothetical protein
MKILLVCIALTLAGCAAGTGGSGGSYAAATDDDIEQKLYEIKQQQQQNLWQERMDRLQEQSQEQSWDLIHQLDQ